MVSFVFHTSAFHVSVGKVQYSHFRFHTSVFRLLVVRIQFSTFAGASNFHASALKTFGGNNCLFSNWICLCNGGFKTLMQQLVFLVMIKNTNLVLN
ncbi:hypothetical protein BXU11_16050 [Flavobacterium sp. LM5]|nr:hypothetical protein BXU11_16050 [Flavobacterium sp. LM5]